MSTYDGLGQKTAMYTPAPAGQSGFETTTYAYDSDGDLVTTTAPPATNGGAESGHHADLRRRTGNLASMTTGSGTSAASTTSFCYDPNGDRTAVVAADGNTGGTATCETLDAVRRVGNLVPDPGRLPDHLQLRLGRGGDLEHEPGHHARRRAARPPPRPTTRPGTR